MISLMSFVKEFSNLFTILCPHNTSDIRQMLKKQSCELLPKQISFRHTNYTST